MRRAQDVVLIHGLVNRHRWSDAFLDAIGNRWGSGHVYVIYTNAANDVKEKVYNGNVIYTIGRNNGSAGTRSLDDQTKQMEDKVQILRKDYGLEKTFNIIGHSMGGLVARQYIYHHPETIANLVTLGTPHHGSPLADYYRGLGFILRARKAFANTNPKWLKRFNARYPVVGAPLCNGGKMYTIRGNAEGKIRTNWGTLGEVYFGWLTLRFLKRMKNDGLVPYDSAIIDGAEHIGDFPECDHLGLVIHPSVANRATIALRGEEAKTGT